MESILVAFGEWPRAWKHPPGWKGKAPQTVKVDGKEVPAAVVKGKLLLQVLGRVEKEKAVVEVHEGK